jgi:hypothetical protein
MSEEKLKEDIKIIIHYLKSSMKSSNIFLFRNIYLSLIITYPTLSRNSVKVIS